MARPLRFDIFGGVYHVIARGNERKPVFRDGRDREIYLERLAECRDRFGFLVYGYCLMTNHVHLALERREVPLSRIMLNLQSFYGQRFNRRHDRVGHLFQGRYSSFLVQKERYLLALIRYIHLNPVKAGLAARPQDYRWSSDRFYRGGSGPAWLDRDPILRLFSNTRAQSAVDYRRFMEGASSPLYEEAEARCRAIKGDRGFAEEILMEAGVPGASPRRWAAEEVAAIVASCERLSVEDLRGRVRAVRLSRARAMAAHLARRSAGLPIARMARFLGRDESTMVGSVLKLEAAIHRDGRLRARVAAITAMMRREFAGDVPPS